MYSAFSFPYRNPIRNIPHLFLGLRLSFQRAFRGYDAHAVTDIDLWFNGVVPDMLREFRKLLDDYPEYGYPARFQDEFYEKHREELEKIGVTLCEELDAADVQSLEKKEWSRRRDEECSARWKGIIDDMIFLFEEANEETCSKQLSLESTADEILAADNYRAECRKKAFSLFCEYFENLWI